MPPKGRPKGKAKAKAPKAVAAPAAAAKAGVAAPGAPPLAAGLGGALGPGLAALLGGGLALPPAPGAGGGVAARGRGRGKGGAGRGGAKPPVAKPPKPKAKLAARGGRVRGADAQDKAWAVLAQCLGVPVPKGAALAPVLAALGVPPRPPAPGAAIAVAGGPAPIAGGPPPPAGPGAALMGAVGAALGAVPGAVPLPPPGAPLPAPAGAGLAAGPPVPGGVGVPMMPGLVPGAVAGINAGWPGAVGAVDGPWVSGPQAPHAVTATQLRPGMLLEASTLDQNGTTDGTALYRVEVGYQPDALGIFFLANFCGASSPGRSGELDAIFTAAPGQPPPLCHLCVCPRTACSATTPGRQVLHLDLFRVRAAAGVIEPWVRQHAIQSAAGWYKPPGAPPPTPCDIEQLQKQVKDLKAALRKRAAGAAGSLFTAAEGKRRRQDTLSDDEEEGPLFQEAPSRSETNRIQVTHQRHPGALFAAGLQEISRFLGEREGAEAGSEGTSARVLAYLNSIFHGKHSVAEVGPRTAKEMRTLALAMDSLQKGELPVVADILMQRFKALELAHGERSWVVASNLELAGDQDGLASHEERHQAARHAMLQKKLLDARARASPRDAG